MEKVSRNGLDDLPGCGILGARQITGKPLGGGRVGLRGMGRFKTESVEFSGCNLPGKGYFMGPS